MNVKHQKLTDKIQKLRSCKRSSARVYASNISRIHREFLPNTTYNQDLKWLSKNSMSLLKKLAKVENLNTQRNMLAAAIVALDLTNNTDKPKYVAQIAKLNKLKQKQLESGEMTEKQLAKFMDWNQIVKLRRLLSRTVRLGRYYSRKSLTRGEFQTLQQNVVLHLYTLLPPVRNDWGAVRYLTEAEFDDLSEDQKTTSNNLVLSRGGVSCVLGRLQNSKKTRCNYASHSETVANLAAKACKVLKSSF